MSSSMILNLLFPFVIAELVHESYHVSFNLREFHTKVHHVEICREALTYISNLKLSQNCTSYVLQFLIAKLSIVFHL